MPWRLRRTILCDRVADPAVGGRSVGNELVSVASTHSLFSASTVEDSARRGNSLMADMNMASVARRLNSAGLAAIVSGIQHWPVLLCFANRTAAPSVNG